MTTAFRKASLKYHPDKLKREPTEEDKKHWLLVQKAYETLQDPIKSTKLVYQLKQLSEPLYPGGTLSLQEGVRPDIPSLEWTVYEEGQCDIIQHILDGNSAFITGPPGTGKSWLLKEIRERLLESGAKVQAIAPHERRSTFNRGADDP